MSTVPGVTVKNKSNYNARYTAFKHQIEQLSIVNLIECLKPGVHTNDFVTIHGRPARIHTAPAESTVDSTYCLPQALCEYARGDRESW